MSDDDRIDFSALDSSTDSRRWEAMIARTTARALATRKVSLFSELSRFTWPLVTAAAVVAAMAIFVARLPGASGSATADSSFSAESFSEWANQGELPHSVDVFELSSGDRG